MIKANPKDAIVRKQIESVEFGYVLLFLVHHVYILLCVFLVCSVKRIS
jgi:hypothetical protein